MKNKIDEIIQIEDNIAVIYSNLYEIDLSGKKYDCIYSHYLNMLKYKISEEKQLFSSFNIYNFNDIFDYFASNREKIEKEFTSNKFSKFIVDRIVKRIQDYIFDASSFDEVINNEKISKNFKNKNKMQRIVISESEEIFLSFLDEYISNCDDSRIKEYLIYDKYCAVFWNATNYEKRIVNCEFNIDSSLYIDSELQITLEGLNMNEYYNIKNDSGSSSITKLIQDLFVKNFITSDKSLNYIERAENVKLLLKIRTCSLLMNDYTFNNFIFILKDNIIIYNKINKLINTDIVEILKKDRERHKRLSLIIKENN